MFKEEKKIPLKVLSALIAVSALSASIIGMAYPVIYKPIVLFSDLSFVFVQDGISFLAAALLLLITFFNKKENINLSIVQAGIVGYLFYAYGLYVMGTLYNYFYFLYLSIFGLSIFYFINAFAGIEYEKLEFSMPESLRLVFAVFCAVVPVVFLPQWISLIMGFIHDGSRPSGGNFDFFVGIPILDLCFVIPVFAVNSIFLFRKKPLGIILVGILLMKLFTLFLSVGAGYLLQPLFQNEKMDLFNALLYSILAFVCMVLGIFYFRHVKAMKIEPARV